MTQRPPLPGAGDVARMLAADMAGLVAELLPAARRHGREMVVGSLAGEAGSSLSICIAGARQGVWADFAAGQGGDALDLVAAVRFRCDKAAAWRWGLRRLGYAAPGEARDAKAPSPAPLPPTPSPARAAQEREAQQRRRKAQALFLAAAPLTGACPASLYLSERGLPLSELGRIPRALRFHPRCWCAEAGGERPAMVAAITDGEGQHLATHRTWIAQDGKGAWRKAPLRDAKKVLGGFAGGFIPVWRGATGQPMRKAPQGEPVVMAEGIETALSIALAAPEYRVIAAVSLANMGRVLLPAHIGEVIVAADNDAPDSPASIALERALAHLGAEGRTVRVARSPIGNDFNDALTAPSGGDRNPQ